MTEKTTQRDIQQSFLISMVGKIFSHQAGNWILLRWETSRMEPALPILNTTFILKYRHISLRNINWCIHENCFVHSTMFAGLSVCSFSLSTTSHPVQKFIPVTSVTINQCHLLFIRRIVAKLIFDFTLQMLFSAHVLEVIFILVLYSLSDYSQRYQA